ncbi:C40 family peptidase [Sporichthya brevicatena]|uniref:C40 family peptidase n=1 Tax=Sporichthya brevicatena TaxID=171442 RepID=A0ABN1G616_9ACTN
MSLFTHAAGVTLAVALTAPAAAVAPGLGGLTEAHATSTAPTVSTAESATVPPTRASRAQQRAEFGKRTVRVASRYRGVPYRSGGTTPRGFDCSGYTRFVLDKLGRNLPRTSQQQYKKAQRIKKPKRGDLIFFHSSSGRVYHVAIYAGNNRIWHAPRPGDHVKREKIWTKRWTAGRYF